MRTSWVAVLILASIAATPVPAETARTATFTLDGFSFVSFGDEVIVRLPAGSTIQFQFGSEENGVTPFKIRPEGVSIADVPFDGGTALRYAIVEAASGTMTPTAIGRRLEFDATIEATLLTQGAKEGSQRYEIHFTTEAVTASDLSGEQVLKVSGARVVGEALYGQMVGATTNPGATWPKPGAAVVTVLSGRFDIAP